MAPTSTTPSAGDLTSIALAAKSTPLCSLPHLCPNPELTDILSNGDASATSLTIDLLSPSIKSKDWIISLISLFILLINTL